MTRLVWGKDRPKEPGEYWWRRGKSETPHIITVFWSSVGESELLACPYQCKVGHTPMLKWTGEFAGPLPMPMSINYCQ